VRVVERSEQAGGGIRTAELTRPGFCHDLCASVHPMAAAAPFFREFDLAGRGVRLVHPEIPCAHPLDGGRAVLARRSLVETADGLGRDAAAYRRLMGPLVEHGEDVVDYFLASAFRRLCTRSVPAVASFGLNGLPSIRWLTRRWFETEEPRALLAGAAAHGMRPLTRAVTGGLGLLQGMLAHHVGWPVVGGRVAADGRRDDGRPAGAGR
jgi:phytoene dehydrogenase-like protein